MEEKEGLAILFAQGCVHDDWPNQKGFVRGSIHGSRFVCILFGCLWIQNQTGELNRVIWGSPESGYVITAVSETECNLTYVVQADPCGYIPVWLVNALADDQALNVRRIKDYFEDNPDERAMDVSDVEE
jgi:hypothetical protein